MNQKVNPIPTEYNSITAGLTVKDAAEAIEFYTQVLGGVEVMRMPDPHGGIMHAEIQFGNSRIMLGEEHPEFGSVSPLTLGGTPVRLNLYVEDADAVAAKALAAGATELMPMRDEFYGDRTGTYQDPFGHIWFISTHIEDVSDQEMQRRLGAMLKDA